MHRRRRLPRRGVGVAGTSIVLGYAVKAAARADREQGH